MVGESVASATTTLATTTNNSSSSSSSKAKEIQPVKKTTLKQQVLTFFEQNPALLEESGTVIQKRLETEGIKCSLAYVNNIKTMLRAQ